MHPDHRLVSHMSPFDQNGVPVSVPLDMETIRVVFLARIDIVGR